MGQRKFFALCVFATLFAVVVASPLQNNRANDADTLDSINKVEMEPEMAKSFIRKRRSASRPSAESSSWDDGLESFEQLTEPLPETTLLEAQFASSTNAPRAPSTIIPHASSTNALHASSTNALHASSTNALYAPSANALYASSTNAPHASTIQATHVPLTNIPDASL